MLSFLQSKPQRSNYFSHYEAQLYKQLTSALKMSKKGYKHTQNQKDRAFQGKVKEHDSEEMLEGSARRRLKKLSEVNPAEQMIRSSEDQDDQYLVNQAHQEEQQEFKPKNQRFVQKREAAEQHKKAQKGRGLSFLDKFVEKGKQRQLARKQGKDKPRHQLTIEETMRFKKQQKKPRNKDDDFVVADDEELSQEAQIRKAKRISTYEQYNGSMDDEQKLIEMAMKLSLTAAPAKHQHLENYAYEDVKAKPVKKEAEKEVKKQQPIHSKLDKSAGKHRQPKSQVKKQVKKTKSMSKQPKSGPLAGLVIAFTGGYEGFDKDKLIEVCQQLGAQCPKSITKKCNLLLQGSHVEDQFKRKTSQPVGETNKSKEAREKRIRIVPYSQIEDFFVEKTGLTLDDLINKNQVKSNPIDSFIARFQEDNFKKEQQPMDIEKAKVRTDGRLWSEKYKPMKLQQIIGESSQIKMLREWLQSWQDIHIRGNKREVKQAKGWNAGGNINSAAALISGDPGTGKTTTARLLAAQYNYSVTEFNASDVRNKKGVSSLENVSYNLDIFHNLTRPLIIMDEVDGMSSGDRGGVAAIIAKIKSTKVPIICICNDRSSEKIRSLATHCLDVKFHKPHKGMIVKRLKQILLLEGGSGEDRALQQLVQTFQNDMRQLLSYLQVIFKTVSRRITVDALSARNRSAKDSNVMINHFDAARRLLNRTEFSALKIQQRTQCFFVDSDIVPIMVHENILSSTKKTFSDKDFHKVVEAMKGIAFGDMLERTIRKQQEWGLMPSFGFMTCVYPTEKISESLGFPQFPSWLGKFSSERKMKRLAKQFKNAIYPITLNASNRTAKNVYAPILSRELADMIGQDNVEEAVLLMEQYRISPPLISEHLCALYYTGGLRNPLSELPAGPKGKVTRLYNKRHQQAKLIVKTKGKTKVEPHKHIKYDPLMEEPEEEIQQQPQSDKEKDKQESISIVERKGKSKGKQSKPNKK